MDRIRKIREFILPYALLGIVFVWALYSSYFIYGNLNAVMFEILTVALVLLGGVRADIKDILLIIGLFLWQYIYNGEIKNACISALVYWGSYYIGKLIGKNVLYVKKWHLVFAVAIICVVQGVRAVLNYSYIIINGPDSIWQMWGMANYMPRTQHEFYIILSGVMLVFWVLFIKKNKLAILGIAYSVAMIFLALYGQGKMTLCATIVVGIIVGTAYVVEYRTIVEDDKLIKGSIIFGTGLLILYIIGRYLIGFFGMIWSKDGGVLHNVRFILWKNALKLMIEHPFESTKEIQLAREIDSDFESCAHNSWIDIGRTGGVIPFILIIAFTVMLFVCCYKLWKNENSVEKYAIIVPFIGVTLYHMFEPAILANPAFWSTEVFLGGIIVGWWYGVRNQSDVKK